MNEKKEEPPKAWRKYCDLQFYKSHLSLCIFILLYVLIQIALIIQRTFRYLNTNPALIVARVGGVLIDFNIVVMVLLVLRKCLTWLRSIKIFRIILPFDHFLEMHKIIGIFIIVASLMHTIGHLVNMCKLHFFVEN